MFEIKFVKHQDPFYQLGKLYVYKLQVELFQYSSEKIDTGVSAIDAFETLKTFSTNTTRTPYGEVISVTLTNAGAGYTSAPTVSFSGTGSGATATAYLGNGINTGKVTKVIVTNPGIGYTTAPTVVFTGGGFSTTAVATSTVEANVDRVESFGDNNKFKVQAADVLFNVANPFGEVDITTPLTVQYATSADITTIYADSTIITADAA
jgi:hypothetical protein